MFRKKYFLDKQTFLQYEAQDPVSEEKLNRASHSYQKLFYLAQRLGNSPISFGTDTESIDEWRRNLCHILQELQKAVHHIHLEYYIVRDDEIGQKIKSVLIQKAREGVKIRFLYDAVGSWRLSKEYIDELKAAGIEMVLFGPVRLPFLNSKFNFRNHRKIIVIDGSTGFVGGLNIGDEYLGRNENYGFWRDTHLMLKGEAVRSLQLIFLQDWYYMTNSSCLTAEYLSPVLKENRYGGVQLIAGGPDNE